MGAAKTVVGTALGVGIFPFIIAGAIVNRERINDHKVLEFQNIIAPGEYNKIKDELLKFATATAALEIKKRCASCENITWDNLEKIMNECVVLEKGRSSTVNEMKTKTLKDLEDVEDKVGYLKLWFRNLIERADSDVYDAMRLGSDEIDSVMSLVLKDVGVHGDFSVSGICKGFLSLFANSIHAKKDILDIGMLRFPTEDRPYVKLYRIRLSSRADGDRVLFIGGDMKVSASVELTSRKYYPRLELIKNLSSDFVSTTVSTFEKGLKN